MWCELSQQARAERLGRDCRIRDLPTVVVVYDVSRPKEPP